jgi:hypothetical protein
MVIAAMNGFDLILVGLLVLVTAFLLRRTFVRGRRSRRRNVLKEVQNDFREAERSAARSVERLEVRLYDYGREIEGQVQTRMARLDRLVVEAEQEAGRLKQLLADSRGPQQDAADTTAGHSSRSPAEVPDAHRSMIVHLADAGYSGEQIANLASRPIEFVQSVLDDERPGRAA